MGQAEDSIKQVCQLEDLKRDKEWRNIPAQAQHLCQVNISEQLGRHCREWTAGRADAEVRSILEHTTKETDLLVYTDGSVTESKSGWGYTVKQAGRTIHEDSAAYEC